MLSPDRWAQLSPQLDELLALTPAAREAQLATLQATDPALAEDLRRLLQAHENAAREDFLGAPLHAGWSDAGPAAGDLLGAWTLEDVVGEGGMGRVWRARRSDGRFEGQAAIKLLRNGLADATAQARFQREGAILARLRHPGIAQLLDAGVSSQGQPYLVLEFVQGERIDRWCEAQALGVRQRVELFLQVLDAVAAAHMQLVIHRDLKPSNILVDQDGRVKLLDFGIARLLADGDAPGDTQLTRAGSAALTPRYAAPEQLVGGALTTATDVYALGIVLCELLTGRHPSGLDGPASLMDYLVAAREREPARASTLAPSQQQALRGDLDNILAKALQAEPAARYASASALADELRRYLRHEPVQARTSSWHYRLARTLRRRPLEAGLTVALASSLVLGAAVALLQARQAEQARDRALQALAASEATNAFVGTLLAESSGATFSVAELLKRADSVLAKDTRSEPETRARLHLLVGNLWAQIDNFNAALAAVQTAREAAARTADTRLLAEVDCTLAHIEAPRGEPERARRRFDAALASLRSGGDEARKPLATCLLDRSDIAIHVDGDPQASLRLVQEVESLLGPDSGGEPMLRYKVSLHKANVASGLGQEATAVAQFEHALELLRTAGRQQSMFAANAWSQLGVSYSRAGLPRRALEAYARAAAIDRGLRPNAQPNPTFEINRAKLLADLGQRDEALPVLQSSVERSKGTANRMATFYAAAVAALPFCAAGQLPTCESLTQEALSHLKAVFPAGHAAYANADMAVAAVHLARGERAAALQRMESATTIFARAKRRSPVQVRALALLCQLNLQQGRLPQAQANAQRLDEVARGLSAGFPQSAWLGISLLTQARVKKAEGDAGAAEALRAQAVEQLRATLGEGAPETREAAGPLSS